MLRLIDDRNISRRKGIGWYGNDLLTSFSNMSAMITDVMIIITSAESSLSLLLFSLLRKRTVITDREDWLVAAAEAACSSDKITKYNYPFNDDSNQLANI